MNQADVLVLNLNRTEARAAESRARMRQLGQTMSAARPPDAVGGWLDRQSLEIQRSYSDLRFELGGQPPSLIEQRLAERGWEVSSSIISEMANSIALAPEFHLDTNGSGYMVIQGNRHDIQGFHSSNRHARPRPPGQRAW